MRESLHLSAVVFRKTQLSQHIASIATLLAISAAVPAMAGETIHYPDPGYTLKVNVINPNNTDINYLYPSQNPSDNVVNISGNKTTDTLKGVYGVGLVNQGLEATGNKVNVTGTSETLTKINGTVAGTIVLEGVGGHTSAKVENNAVFISNGSVKNPWGGEASVFSDNTSSTLFTADANRNSVSITNSLVVESVGGLAHASTPEENSVTESTAIGNANNNSVTIINSDSSNAAIGGDVTAYSHHKTSAISTANANHNTVSASNSSVSSLLGGRVSVSSTATSSVLTANTNDHTLSVNKSTVGAIWGGDALVNAYDDKSGANSVNATINANNSTIFVNDHSSITNAGIFGAWVSIMNQASQATISADANNHTISVNDNSAVKNVIYGGYISSSNDGSGKNDLSFNTNNNTISINDSSAGHVFGGTVNINKSSSSGTVSAAIRNNTISIHNSTMTGDVLGGYIRIKSPAPSETISASINNNTINLSGTTDVTASTLYGGIILDGQEQIFPGDAFTGNTLNLNNWQGNAQNIVNFQTVNIDAPVVQNNSVILALNNTSGTQLGNGKIGDDEVKTAVNLNSVAGGSVLNKGDRIHLIQNDAGISGVNANDGQIKQGISALYDIQYVQDDPNNVDVLILKGKAQDENKVLNENRVAALAFLNGGTDLLIKENLRGKHVFGAIEGGHSRYDTGSSVDIDGVNLIVGVNNAWTRANGEAQAGAFIEAGWGNTSTSNSIGGNHLTGNGDSHYYGAGLLGRYDWTQGMVKGMYVDGSVRIGKLSSDYHNNDLKDAQGNRAFYDIDSLYYGAHAGIGYIRDIGKTYQLDMNARYMWTHIESDNATIAGDRFHFDSMDSHRTRLGGRLNYTADPKFTPYAGLAWEYEFDGDARGSVLGYSMDEASLGGSTGIVELGVNFKPAANGNLTVNAGVTGYFGQREGVAGQFRMTYAF